MTVLISREYLRNLDALLTEAMHPGTQLNTICQEDRLFKKLKDDFSTGLLEEHFVDLEDELEYLRMQVDSLTMDMMTTMATFSAILAELQNHDTVLYSILDKVKSDVYPSSPCTSIPYMSTDNSYRNPRQRLLF